MAARSVWKGPFIEKRLLENVKKIASSGGRKIIKTWSRSSTILPSFVGLIFYVHNGRKFIPVDVSSSMVGRKFGEFAPTRTFFGHGANRKAKRN